MLNCSMCIFFLFCRRQRKAIDSSPAALVFSSVQDGVSIVKSPTVMACNARSLRYNANAPSQNRVKTHFARGIMYRAKSHRPKMQNHRSLSALPNAHCSSSCRIHRVINASSPACIPPWVCPGQASRPIASRTIPVSFSLPTWPNILYQSQLIKPLTSLSIRLPVAFRSCFARCALLLLARSYWSA
jgi:hypothetical protein